MTNEIAHINNVETGELIERKLTNAEQAERDAQKAILLAEIEDAKTKDANLRALKISAYQKQGLTAEEIEAILPTPVEII